MNKYNYDMSQPLYIAAGGPSLKGFDWNLLNGKNVIAINRSFEVLPNAQVVYFTDNAFWEVNKAGLLGHKGLKIKGSLNTTMLNDPNVENYTLNADPWKWDEAPGKLRHGNNSGYAVINLAVVHMDFKEVYLLGYDMKWSNTADKNTSHWHSGYKTPGSATVYASHMLNGFKHLLPMLDKYGAKVINLVNPACESALTTFPKMTIEEHFNAKSTSPTNQPA